MESEKKINQKKWTVKRVIRNLLLSILILVSAGLFYVYNNFNNIVTEAVYSTFNSNIISNVYELKFKKLRLNFVTGTIRVIDVELLPWEKPLKDYPYINSSFSLKTSKILLKNIDLIKLFKQKKLELSRIEILNPEIELKMSGEKIEFIPYKDSTHVKSGSDKKRINSYFLAEFDLINASIHSENTDKER